MARLFSLATLVALSIGLAGSARASEPRNAQECMDMCNSQWAFLAWKDHKWDTKIRSSSEHSMSTSTMSETSSTWSCTTTSTSMMEEKKTKTSTSETMRETQFHKGLQEFTSESSTRFRTTTSAAATRETSSTRKKEETTTVREKETTTSSSEQAKKTKGPSSNTSSNSKSQSNSNDSGSSSNSGSSNAEKNGSRASDADVQTYLDTHNSIRRQHGAVDVQWSNDAAEKAQEWADKCLNVHSGGQLGPLGENLAAGTGVFTITDAVKAWTDEVTEFDPNNPVPSHFTQVVWKASTLIGCAVQTCDNIFPGFGPAQYYVCEYSVQGNVIGHFAENVQA